MSKNRENKKTKDRYLTLVDDEIEFSIVTALNWYESLNLKKIAIMINKPESTTLRYIRKLKNNGVITFDSKKSEDSWGKFYKLSSATKKLYDDHMQAMDDRIDRITNDLQDIDKYSEEELYRYVAGELLSADKFEEIPLTRHYFNFVTNLQNVMINEVISKIGDFADVIEKKGRENIIEKIKISPMDVSIYVNHVKLSKWKHMFKINKIIFKFISEIDMLKKEIEEEMNKENVPEEKRSTQFLNIFSGSLDVSYELED
ncbi:MAG: winged helix-turn-helix transcriptional regulator [Candidatus Heimdallarchaeota archaeon]|nr:winged helix-turn-helix transcriptional regulator [Candidatus Heimdallarchaeota archaeon]MCK4876541.1 winged helix-turn-helix transcriptional regulator [Candidatus Heimdallarchaeota archaeon]